MDDVQLARFEVGAVRKTGIVNSGLSGHTRRWSRISNDTNALGLRVKLGRTHFNLALGGRVRPRIVCEVNRSRLKAKNVAHERTHMDLWMWLDHIDLVLKVHWAVTFHLKLLRIRLSNQTCLAHVDEFGEQFILRRIYNWKRMDWNQYLIPIAVNPHRVIVVLVLIHSWSELNVNVLRDSCGDHSLLLIANLEVICLRRQNMQSLWRWRIINQSKFHRVCLICLKAGEFDHTW